MVGGAMEINRGVVGEGVNWRGGIGYKSRVRLEAMTRLICRRQEPVGRHGFSLEHKDQKDCLPMHRLGS